jgi:poly(hydroxyalkanoate) granule-associated protein
MTEAVVSGGAQATPEQEGAAAGGFAGGLRQVGLAGLGLVAIAGEGIGDLFGRLVEKGEAAAPRGRDLARSLGDKVGGLVEPASRKLHTAWDGLGGKLGSFTAKGEEMVDGKLAASLRRMGVPTKEDLQSLMARVDAVAAALEEMKAQSKDKGRTRE